MPIFRMEKQINAPSHVIWPIVSDVEGFAEAVPSLTKAEVLSGEKVGMKRHMFDKTGRGWTETCVEWEEGHRYAMEVNTTDYPYPLSRMRRTWGVEQRAEGNFITMEYEYTPKYGAIGWFIDKLWYTNYLKHASKGVFQFWEQKIRSREWAYLVNVASILKDKGSDIVTVTPDASIIDTARLLAEKRIGSVLALDQNGAIAGVVSERDIVRGIAERGHSVLERPVSEIMTRKVVVCSPDNDMVFIMACMTDRRLRHLPVMEGDKILGIISIGDVVKARIADLETQSAGFRDYIDSRKWRELHMSTGESGIHPFG